MNREIKFRVWDVEYKGFTDLEYALEEYGWDLVMNSEHYVVNQFTGRKDRFGSDLYEGDIVTENDQLAVCVWMSEAGGFAFVPTSLYPCDLKTLIINHGTDNFFVNDPPEHFVTIVGNIHQHKHLLGVSE